VESSAEEIRVQKAVLSAVENLKEPYRQTIWLRFYEDQPPRRIAARMDVPVETVKTRLKRALEQLRARLDGEYGGEQRAWCLALAPAACARETAVASFAMAGLGVVLVSGVALLVAIAWPSEGQAVVGLEPSGSEHLVEDTTAGGGVLEPVAALPEPQRNLVPGGEGAGQAELASLTLDVTWPEGDPAVGIEVSFLPQDANWPAREAVHRRTDSRGVVVATELRPGTILVHDDRGNRLEHELEPGARDRREFRLQPGVDVVGRVVDDRGNPIASAGIWLGETETDGYVESRTNTSGEFHLRHVGPWAKVAARAQGFQPSELEFLRSRGALLQERIALEFRLAGPEGRVRGLVLDPEGNPVPNARVKIGGEFSESAHIGVGWVPLAEATTSSLGVFEQGGLLLGSQSVHVLAEGFPVAVARVDLEGDGVAWVDVRLEPSSTVTGVVTEDGSPVKGAEIFLYQAHESSRWNSPFPLPEAHSSDDGSFRMDHVPAGLWSVVAEGPRGVGEASTELDIGAGEELEWSPVLERGLVVQGRVVDELGAPLEHWSVTAQVPGQFRRQCYTDRDGGFVLTNCIDAPLEVTVRNLALGLLLPVVTVQEVTPDGDELLLRVPSLERFSGSVVGVALGAGGEPLSAGNLEIEMEGERLRPLADFDGRTGQFEFTNLGPGRYRVRVASADGVNGLEWFELREGERRNLGRCTFEPPGSLIVFTKPDPRTIELLSEVRVAIQPVRGGRRLEPARSGANWSLDAIDPGDYWIQFSEPFDQSLRPFTVEAAQRTVLEYDLNLCRETTVDFLEPEGRTPMNRMDVEVYRSDGALAWKWTRAADDNWPVLRMVVSLDEGTYRVNATTDTGLRAEVPLVIDWNRGREPHVIELR